MILNVVPSSTTRAIRTTVLLRRVTNGIFETKTFTLTSTPRTIVIILPTLSTPITELFKFRTTTTITPRSISTSCYSSSKCVISSVKKNPSIRSTSCVNIDKGIETSTFLHTTLRTTWDKGIRTFVAKPCCNKDRWLIMEIVNIS